jgi:hypothetical protein
VKLNYCVAKEEEDILDWLCPLSRVDPSSDQEERRKLRTVKTATWIFENSKYKKWLNEPGAFLWLHGQSSSPKFS